MERPLFSPSWYRVAKLTPRLRGHAHVHRHDYRGETWYVLQDHATGRYYRFTPAAYRMIGRMDGKRTVQRLWDEACEVLGDDGPTQGEVIELLGQLHSSNVLVCDVPPDTAELLSRSRRVRRSEWIQKLRSPLAIRIPLLDPERFLARTAWLARPLFTGVGALLWACVVAAGVVMAALHWSELSRDVVDRVLSAQNLVALWFIYPVVKALHELGHGYATKVWGGEVHEVGLMLLVFMPVPYVDASAASEFRSKHRRAIVGAAGILVELFVAALALMLWLQLQPGLLRSVAYNVMLIGGLSTLFFNGNPLLRYDGYYVLSDLLEIPNLAQRGTRYLGFLVQRRVFRARDVAPPHVAPGEAKWLVGYTLAAFVYRLFIYFAIVLFIAGKFFVVGILLAAWAVVGMIVTPVFKGLRFLFSSPVLRERRPRAILISAATLAAVLALLFLVPLPLRTRAEGVVWVPEEALVRAGSDGFVRKVVAADIRDVARGDLLVECEDPFLSTDVRVQRARLAELESRYEAALTGDRVQAQIIAEELSSVREALARAEERQRELAIRSPIDGLFVLPLASDLPGRFVRQGDLIGYVIDIDRPTVRVVVPQAKVDLVRRRTARIDVRLAAQPDAVVRAALRREVPEGARELPSTILGAAGGGEIAIDPLERSGTKAFENLFQFELELERPPGDVFIGGRAYVRFDHGLEPLAFRLYRGARQVFLRRFNV